MGSVEQSDSLRRTPLNAWHAANGGRLVDFAGWSMPVQYSSIVEEHNAVRHHVGLFDVSHMGRIRIDGPGAGAFLDRMLTRRVVDAPLGKVRYGLVANETGGIKDDVLASHIAGAKGDYRYLVVNAGNRDKLAGWFASHLPKDGSVIWQDESDATAMIAVQGPHANLLVAGISSLDPGKLGYYSGAEAKVLSHPALVSRTGYTGEDGCEIIVPASAAEQVWTKLLEDGRSLGAKAIGLGARDTLRLEAGMPLYGHELSETTSPWEAGLSMAVDLADRDFVGRAALAASNEAPPARRRVGIVLQGRRPAREGYAVFAGDARVGEITSGTFSPTLDRPIAMAYVGSEFANIDQALSIDVRGTRLAGRVVPLPFYKRPSSKK